MHPGGVVVQHILPLGLLGGRLLPELPSQLPDHIPVVRLLQGLFLGQVVPLGQNGLPQPQPLPSRLHFPAQVQSQQQKP